MAPVVPFLGLIGSVVAAGTTVATTIMNNKQAEKANERNLQYQKELAAQEAATAAEEKRLAQEAQQRSRAYGASLLSNDTNLQNMLSVGYNEGNLGSSSLLVNNVGSSSVQSMFA